MSHTSPSHRRVWAAAAVAALTTAILVACAPAAPPDDDEFRSVTIAVGMVYQPHDPALGGLIYDNFETQAVFEGLGYWDFESNTLVPVLAESFDVAADGLSVEVTLRDDVDFVDGTHLDAAGAVKYFEYVLASEKYELGGAVAKYEAEFEATGEYTFTISTVIPIYFPVSFAFLMQTPVVSPATIDDPEATADEAIGTGPYVIDEFTVDTEIVLTRNPAYRDPDAYPFDEVVLKVFDDSVAQLNALLSGQVDVIGVGVEDAQRAADEGFTLHEISNSYVALQVRDPVNSSVEALRDVRVREAIMLAFDREAIAENVYAGFASPAYQAYTEGQPEYVEDAGDRYAYDPDRARELLAEAGYPDGFDVTLLVGAVDGVLPAVKQSLEDIGIRVTFDAAISDGYELFKASLDGSQAITFGGGIYGNTTRLLDEEFVGLGTFFEPSPEIVELMANIRGADPDAAAEASVELGEYMFDELWYLPIVSVPTIWATTPDLEIDADSAWVVKFDDLQLAD
jgi:peptide/nickel transport system substrate-binding protein